MTAAPKLCKDSFPKQISWYQYTATAIGSLAMMTSGMHFGWPSPSLPQLLNRVSKLHITSSDGSWLSVMPCIGAPFGAIIGTLLVDRIGRKTSMLLVSPVYFVMWLAIAYAPNVLILVVARFIVGLMDGILFTVLPIYIAEISDPSIRGLLGCSIVVIYVLGFLLINLLGLYCSIKVTALVSSLIPVLHFIGFCWMPESPFYYMLKKNTLKAASSLQKLTGTLNVDATVSQIHIKNSITSSLWETSLNLFTVKRNRKILVIVLGLRIFQQFSGNSTIAFYCLIIFNEIGVGFVSENILTLIYFSVQLLASVVSSILVDRSGRRPLLILSITGSGISLATLGVYFYLKQTKHDVSSLSFLSVIALFLYNLLYNLGLGTIPMLMLGEVFPTNIKAFAVALADIFYGLIIVVASKFFQITKDEFGMYFPFLTFSLFCAAGLLFIVVYVPETKGKTLGEIQKELQ